MGADVAAEESSSKPVGPGSETAAGQERLDPRRRRPWLGIICAVLLVGAGVAWWVHAESPFNPYRDGTTHAATLTYTDPPCLQGWTVTVADRHYTWQNMSPVPDAFKPGPVPGTVHILRQRVDAIGTPKAPAATFTARGQTIDLVGGTHWWSDLTCSIP